MSSTSDKIVLRNIGLGVAVFIAGRLASYAIIQYFHNRCSKAQMPDEQNILQEVTDVKKELGTLKDSLSLAIGELRKELDVIKRGVRSIRKRHRHIVQPNTSNQSVESYHTAWNDDVVRSSDDLNTENTEVSENNTSNEPETEAENSRRSVYFEPGDCLSEGVQQGRDEEPMEVTSENDPNDDVSNDSQESILKSDPERDPFKGNLTLELTNNRAQIVTKHSSPVKLVKSTSTPSMTSGCICQHTSQSLKLLHWKWNYGAEERSTMGAACRTIKNSKQNVSRDGKRNGLTLPQDGGAFHTADRLLSADAKNTLKFRFGPPV